MEVPAQEWPKIRAFLCKATNPTDFNFGTLIFPGNSFGVNYSPAPGQTPPYVYYDSPDFPDQASLDAAFPVGTYTAYVINNSMLNAGSVSTSLNYTVDAYPHTIPQVSAASYNALQGMNPAVDLAVDFNSFIPDPNATGSFVFLDIDDLSGNEVFGDDFLPSTATSVTIPADTLLADTGYTYRLIFSDRIDSTNPHDGTTDELGFDFGTDGAFTTGGTPEPTALAAGALCATFMFRRRSPARRR